MNSIIDRIIDDRYRTKIEVLKAGERIGSCGYNQILIILKNGELFLFDTVSFREVVSRKIEIKEIDPKKIKDVVPVGFVPVLTQYNK